MLLNQDVLNQDVEDYVNSLVKEYPDIESVWLIGSRANESFNENSDWDFLVFGSRETLKALSDETRFHKDNIDLLVVYDGNDFEKPWGEKKKSGSLTCWEWKKLSFSKAQYKSKKSIYYNENGEEEFNVKSTICRAICIFSLEESA